VVREVFGRHFRIKLQYENASRLFLDALKGVTEPERKRKIIGKTFIKVFERATQRAARPNFWRKARCIRMSLSQCPSRESRGDDQEPP